MSRSELVRSISAELNDREHIAWSRSDIERWISEGIDLAFDIRPDYFRSSKVLAVRSGMVPQEVDGIDYILDVVGQSTKHGRVTNRLRRISVEQTPWLGSECPNKTGRLTAFKIRGNNELYLYPPILPGTDTYIVIICAIRSEYTEHNLPRQVKIPISQWVLYKARNQDSESAVVADMGESNYNKMKELLGFPTVAYEVQNAGSGSLRE